MQLAPVFMNSRILLEVLNAIAMVGRFPNTRNFVMTVWRNQTRKEFADYLTRHIQNVALLLLLQLVTMSFRSVLKIASLEP